MYPRPMRDQLTLLAVFFVVLVLYVVLRRAGAGRISTRPVFPLPPLKVSPRNASRTPDLPAREAAAADDTLATFVLRARGEGLPLSGVHRVASALGFGCTIASVGNLIWTWPDTTPPDLHPYLSLLTLEPLPEGDRTLDALERVLAGTTAEVSLVFSVRDNPAPDQVLDRALLTTVEMLRALDAELLVDGRVVDIAQARSAVLPRLAVLG